MEVKDPLMVGVLHVPHDVVLYPILGIAKAVIGRDIRRDFGLHQRPVEQKVVVQGVEVAVKVREEPPA